MCDNKEDYVQRVKMRVNNKLRLIISKEIVRYNKQFPEDTILSHQYAQLNDYIDDLFNEPKPGTYKWLLRYFKR